MGQMVQIHNGKSFESVQVKSIESVVMQDQLHFAVKSGSMRSITGVPSLE